MNLIKSEATGSADDVEDFGEFPGDEREVSVLVQSAERFLEELVTRREIVFQLLKKENPEHERAISDANRQLFKLRETLDALEMQNIIKAEKLDELLGINTKEPVHESHTKRDCQEVYRRLCSLLHPDKKNNKFTEEVSRELFNKARAMYESRNLHGLELLYSKIVYKDKKVGKKLGEKINAQFKTRLLQLEAEIKSFITSPQFQIIKLYEEGNRAMSKSVYVNLCATHLSTLKTTIAKVSVLIEFAQAKADNRPASVYFTK